MLVVLKPAGLATQAPRAFDSLERRIKAFLKERDAKHGRVYLGVPHRLDRPVSGAMVFAKHSRAARRLSRQFERREVRKIYWMCVSGEVAPPCGIWTDWLRKVPGEVRAEVVEPNHPDRQRAILHYRTLGVAGFVTWLEIELQTGRMHQVRIQAASRGWPVLGDAVYGSQVPFGPATDDVRARQIALHGRSLSFRHPMSGEKVHVTADADSAWHALGVLVPP